MKLFSISYQTVMRGELETTAIAQVIAETEIQAVSLALEGFPDDEATVQQNFETQVVLADNILVESFDLDAPLLISRILT